ncbi:hypothetical protein Gpo141_00014452, partial [Globisporangium polare]
MKKNQVQVLQTQSDTKHARASSSSSGWRGYAILPIPPRHGASKQDPTGPALRIPKPRPTTKQLSFSEVFGILGLPMLLIVLVCIAWTSWLVLLTCAPTWTANYLMNTADFDDGN